MKKYEYNISDKIHKLYNLQLKAFSEWSLPSIATTTVLSDSAIFDEL